MKIHALNPTQSLIPLIA